MSTLDNLPTNPLLQIAVPLIDTHLTTILSFLWKLGQRIMGERLHPGDYEILDFEGTLELIDGKGKQAIFTKRERVRFLQNNVIAYQDMAWGSGNIFADYDCSPGWPVDTYREGYRYHMLISLRETKNRGDIVEFNIRRKITDGFLKPDESFQHDVSHLTHIASLRVIFPKARVPKEILLIEQNSTRTTPLDLKNQTTLADGRLQVTWQQPRPRLFESYLIRWTW